MSWIEYAVAWQVYPLGFVGAPAEANVERQPVRRLPHLTSWLDYAVTLGASAFALGPVFASQTHGYDTVDHYRVDPRLGTRADLDDLLDQAHKRGLRVIFDGVFGHVGREHPRFRRALLDGPDSDAAAWFRHDGTGYATFEGHHGLVALNHDNPAVAEHVQEVLAWWLDAGVDGWRLDAAYTVPATFWSAVLDPLRPRFPAAYFMGEVIHGDYAATVTASGFDSVTQYELWKAVWSSLNDRNLHELAWALKRHNTMLDTFVPWTFVGNHDVTRIASALDDIRHLPHALAVLFCTGGTPAVYYGDEQAFRGVKEHRAGGDDAIRPAFPATPTGLAPWGADTFRLHQDLIGFRRRHPWLHRARTTPRALTNISTVLASTDDGHTVLLALNLADHPVTHELDATVEFSHQETRYDDGKLELPAHGWAVLTA
jgi:cyclomaltodextrinase